VKSATISFGQSLDPQVIERAAEAAADCDVFIAVGTSLTVQPAAGLCDVAVRTGARLVILNAQATPYDELADAVLRDSISDVLPVLLTG
jgi:NAD-dependent deacetylase